MARWLIERETGDVRKDGRLVKRARDVEDAVRYVAKNFTTKDRVDLQEEDGYKNNLSRYFERGSATRLNL